MTVRITGYGDFSQVTIADDPGWRDIKVYPASATLEGMDPLGIRGTKVFNQVVIPEHHEVRQIPSFAFSYFDPAKKVYETITHDSIDIHVMAAERSFSQPVILATRNLAAGAQAPQDLIHILHPPQRSAVTLALLLHSCPARKAGRASTKDTRPVMFC